MQPKHLETATFGGGCFWCTEAIFRRLKGVESVTSGYSGGQKPDPNYDQVSTGATGHAESIQIEFDPSVIGFDKLLDIFFATHNPTTLNQQGADMGSQYRSVVFYHNENQKKTTEDKIKEIDKSGKFDKKVVTEVVPFEAFYPAEGYHQDYYDKNKTAPYCTFIIDPKIQKLLHEFGSQVKDEYKS